MQSAYFRQLQSHHFFICLFFGPVCVLFSVFKWNRKLAIVPSGNDINGHVGKRPLSIDTVRSEAYAPVSDMHLTPTRL